MRKSFLVVFLMAGLVLAQTGTKTGKKSTATKKGGAADAVVVPASALTTRRFNRRLANAGS